MFSLETHTQAKGGGQEELIGIMPADGVELIIT